MSLALASAALFAGFALQNIAELRGGGPVLPAPFARMIPGHGAADLRRSATGAITLIVAALIAAAHALDWGWGLAALAAALIANALLQLAQSLRQKRLMPGTIAGLALMLPPALWVLACLPCQPTALLLGPLLSAPLLLLCWALAAQLCAGH